MPYLDDLNITQFACGAKFSLALSIDGKALYSFGLADDGALGTRYHSPVGNEYEHDVVCSWANPIPSQVPFPTSSPIVSISAGTKHCFAVTEDNKVYSWGSRANCRTGFSEYRVFTGPHDYGYGDGPTDYKSFSKKDIYAPTHLILAEHCNKKGTDRDNGDNVNDVTNVTDCVKVFEASGGDNCSLFLVHRMKRPYYAVPSVPKETNTWRPIR